MQNGSEWYMLCNMLHILLSMFFLQLPALVALVCRFNSIMDSSLVFSPFVLLFANAVMIDEKKGEALSEDPRQPRHKFF